MPYRIHDEETRPYGHAPSYRSLRLEISQVSSEPVDAQNAKLLNCLRIVYHNLADASTALFPSREAKGIPGLHKHTQDLRRKSDAKS